MSLSDLQLNQIVEAWKVYAESGPDRMEPRDVLRSRDLNMYRGMSLTDPTQLATALANDRSIATLEMTMGHLYERALEELGPRKVSLEEKRRPGYRGIDFIEERSLEIRLINLKAGLSTSNGDISASTVRNLADAERFWLAQPMQDDNPLRRRERTVTKIRAVARGPSRFTTTTEGIVWVVGDAMWEYFGAGKGFLHRLGAALERNPFDHVRFEKAKASAAGRLLDYLIRGGYVKGGQVDWARLIDAFP
jgi:hypothetical protein